jgi:hypothetical protein
MDKLPWITLATGLVAGLGIGTALTAVIQHALRRREAAFESQRQDLQARYRVVILLMYAAFDFDGKETALRINRPNLKTRQDVLDDLRAEWVNMLLFASEKTLDALGLFISSPTADNLVASAASMRGDLGRGSLPESWTLKLKQAHAPQA